ncbi:MAG: hypothetical protein WC975_04640 [Phycisphaerae bacterium]
MVKKWWKQVTDRIGNKDFEPELSDSANELNVESELKIHTEEPQEDTDTDPGTPGAIGRWMQRRQLSLLTESSIEQMTQTNEKLVSTLDKLSQGFDNQSQNLLQMAQNQDKHVTLMDRHGKILEQMLSEVQRLTSTTDRLSGALEAVPKSSREQSEKLSAIEDQLQSDNQTDRALLRTMDTLGRHVASLARYAEIQQANREEFAKGLALQIQPIIDLVRQQSNYAKINFALTVIIALTLLGIAVIGIVKAF